MRNPFAPNGIKSTKIIYRLAQKEFGNAIKASSSFLSIKKDITKVLKKERETNSPALFIMLQTIKTKEMITWQLMSKLSLDVNFVD